MRSLSTANLALWLVLSCTVVTGCGGGLEADEAEKPERSSVDGDDASDDADTSRDDAPDSSDPGEQQSDDDQGDPGSNPDDPDPDDDGPGSDDAANDDPGSDDPSGDDPSSDDLDDPDVIEPAIGERTRLARLTHTQYQNAVAELFGINDGPAGGFAPDALNGFPFQTSIDFRVGARLAPQYRDAAETLASRAVSTPEIVQRIVPCGDGSCAEQFISEFGLKAFRRPLTDAEHAGFVALFARGGELVGSGDAFLDGVRLVVEAMLQAPQFIYRTELGADVGADGKIALSPWEVAARLSFFLYDSIPDAELFAAASANQLGSVEQIAAQVQRMLAEPRSTSNLVAFHEQAWQFSRYSKIAPDSAEFGELPADLASRMVTASSRFVREVIESGGGFAELLTAPYAFADSALAPLYGTSADDMVRIDLDSTQRKGYLMQVGFLASNAYARKTDPIHRGLFVARDLLCRTIPDPPANASQTPFPDDVPPPQTTREEISILTGQDGCVSCHVTFNDAGYAFEGFDAIGQSRSQENGVDVNTSGTMILDSETFSFDGPIQLIDGLAQSPEVRRCYAGNWLKFAHGRKLTTEELTVADELAQLTSIEALVTALVQTPGFITRTPNEVAE